MKMGMYINENGDVYYGGGGLICEGGLNRGLDIVFLL